MAVKVFAPPLTQASTPVASRDGAANATGEQILADRVC
jgi:hypothetical protein